MNGATGGAPDHRLMVNPEVAGKLVDDSGSRMSGSAVTCEVGVGSLGSHLHHEQPSATPRCIDHMRSRGAEPGKSRPAAWSPWQCHGGACPCGSRSRTFGREAREQAAC